MGISRSTLLQLIAAFVVAPIGAAVMISALLLFGVGPRIVFFPGFLVLAGLGSLGFTVGNAVGVVSTVVFWWAIIVAAWFPVRRLRRRA